MWQSMLEASKTQMTSLARAEIPRGVMSAGLAVWLVVADELDESI